MCLWCVQWECCVVFRFDKTTGSLPVHISCWENQDSGSSELKTLSRKKPHQNKLEYNKHLAYRSVEWGDSFAPVHLGWMHVNNINAAEEMEHMEAYMLVMNQLMVFYDIMLPLAAILEVRWAAEWGSESWTWALPRWLYEPGITSAYSVGRFTSINLMQGIGAKYKHYLQ